MTTHALLRAQANEIAALSKYTKKLLKHATAINQILNDVTINEGVKKAINVIGIVGSSSEHSTEADGS